MNREIRSAQKLCGSIELPGDKSISHRAVMLGSIARGETIVNGLADCDDCNYTIGAFRDLGVAIAKYGNRTAISGVGLRGLERPAAPLYVGESGTSMRILPGILAGQNFESVIKGAKSLSRRPMKRIVEPLSLMGIDISARRGGYPPLRIRGGKVRPAKRAIMVSSAQVKSAVIFAALYGDGVTTVEELFRSRDHTERMVKYFGAKIRIAGRKVSVDGGRELSGRTVHVPGDISSASFFMVGAILLKGSRIKILRVGINPTRTGILNVFSRMGAKYRIVNRVDAFEPYADIEVRSSETKATVIEKSEIPTLIDELPVLFVLAALSKGRTVIRGARELRVKETDRIASMQANLTRMGASFAVKGGDILIDGLRSLNGASLSSFGDHRTVMSMVVASLAAKGKCVIDDIECVNKSFPGFFKSFDAIRG